MADKRQKAEFGLDPAEVKGIDWATAAARVLVDVRSDFIYAPHISTVFRNGSEALNDLVKKELQDGRFRPGAPITIEVPKSARMLVAPTPARGPTFSRPGSILLPKDRLFYQVLADKAAAVIEKSTDRKRSFSHQFAGPKNPDMFEPSRVSWARMQQALNAMARRRARGYVIKADVANCFGSINQHTLINHLETIGYPSTFGKALDAFLVLSTGDRNSRGLLQGIFPSDLFGNFYLNPIDEHLRDLGVESARYVDDIYIFVPNLAQAESITRALTLKLRDYDLGLNEAKSKVLQSRSLSLEEPDLDTLFDKALAERTEEMEDRDDLDPDYGFQSEWEDDEDEDSDSDEDDPVLLATIELFDSQSDFPLHMEKIERFCIPLFSACGSDHAIAHVLANFTNRANMAQIYCNYLSKFYSDGAVRSGLSSFLSAPDVHYDWQRMWILAAILRQKKVPDDIVLSALRIYKDGSRHEALRAVAAILVSKHGSYTRQKDLFDSYGASGSAYLQSAVLYGARYFQRQLRASALKSWRGHSDTHALVAHSITNS